MGVPTITIARADGRPITDVVFRILENHKELLSEFSEYGFTEASGVSSGMGMPVILEFVLQQHAERPIPQKRQNLIDALIEDAEDDERVEIHHDEKKNTIRYVLTSV